MKMYYEAFKGPFDSGLLESTCLMNQQQEVLLLNF